MTNGKFNIQIITAALMSIGGLALLFCGVCIEPQGEIHESLLIGFGEVATFAGTLFGIDAAYAKKLWDITNSSGHAGKAHKSTDSCAGSSTGGREAEKHTSSTSHP